MIRRTLNHPRPFPVPGMGLLIPANVPARMSQGGWQDPTTIAATRSTTPAQSPEDLANEAETLFKQYSGRSLSAPDLQAYEVRPPWIEMPAPGQPFMPQGYIATPATNGLDTVVQTFVVPPGWDGVILYLANFYTGAGFTLGSGYLTWRLLRNGQAMKGFNNIQVNFGTYGAGGLQALSLAGMPIRLFTGETITYVVNHAAGSPLPVAGTQIVTVIGGYLYPRP